jgi:predicted HAD superfamily hydrolase
VGKYLLYRQTVYYVKKIIQKLFSKSQGDIKKCIDEADVISFDLFETLVIRRNMIPESVFIKIEGYYTRLGKSFANGFTEERIKAERRVRKMFNSREISIQDIYDYFDLHGFKIDKKQLIDTEIAFELESAISNKNGKELFEYACKKGKKIIVITDFYFSNSAITNILEKCGYKNIDTIYVSSEYGKTKANGELYELIMDELHNTRIVHIGDNYKVDYVRARQKGFESCILD